MLAFSVARLDSLDIGPIRVQPSSTEMFLLSRLIAQCPHESYVGVIKLQMEDKIEFLSLLS